jgi:hypothetical protein
MIPLVNAPATVPHRAFASDAKSLEKYLMYLQLLFFVCMYICAVSVAVSHFLLLGFAPRGERCRARVLPSLHVLNNVVDGKSRSRHHLVIDLREHFCREITITYQLMYILVRISPRGAFRTHERFLSNSLAVASDVTVWPIYVVYVPTAVHRCSKVDLTRNGTDSSRQNASSQTPLCAPTLRASWCQAKFTVSRQLIHCFTCVTATRNGWCDVQ